MKVPQLSPERVKTMSQWFRKDLGNGMYAQAPTREMQTAFMQVFLRVPVGSGRAMFSRYDLASDNVEVYFTPEAADVALQFNATPCSKPDVSELRISLLCGDGHDIAIHFPEQSRNNR